MDRTLTFKNNCNNIKMEIITRNNLLRKLSGTTWGANPQKLRVTTLVPLCYSAGEYKIDRIMRRRWIALNEICCLITGCLKPAPLLVQVLTSIAYIERSVVISNAKKPRQTMKDSHSRVTNQCRVDWNQRKNFKFNYGIDNIPRTRTTAWMDNVESYQQIRNKTNGTITTRILQRM